MLPAEVANYLHETWRVLRPGGTFFCTAYLLTPASLDAMEHNADAVRFPYEHDGARIGDPDRPAGAVAHFAERFYEQVRDAGFLVEKFMPGQWPGHPSLTTKQDIVVLRKPTA
jgi:hypothetical protein